MSKPTIGPDPRVVTKPPEMVTLRKDALASLRSMLTAAEEKAAHADRMRVAAETETARLRAEAETLRGALRRLVTVSAWDLFDLNAREQDALEAARAALASSTAPAREPQPWIGRVTAIARLIDEAERVVLAEQDAGRNLPFLDSAVNSARAWMEDPTPPAPARETAPEQKEDWLRCEKCGGDLVFVAPDGGLFHLDAKGCTAAPEQKDPNHEATKEITR